MTNINAADYFNGGSVKTLLEQANIGVIIHRWDTSVVYANPTALEFFDLDLEELLGSFPFDSKLRFVNEAGRPLAEDDFPTNRVKRTKQKVINQTMGLVDKSTEEVNWFAVNAYHEGNNDDASFIVVTFTDISASKRLFSFQDVLENTKDIVIITDATDITYPTGPKIVYVNRAFEKLTGYTREDAIGETPRILQGPLTDSSAKKRIHQALTNFEEIKETLLNYDVNGRPYWIELNIIPLKNKFDEVTHFAAIQRDVTKDKFQREQLEKRNQDLKALKRNLKDLVHSRTRELENAKAQLEEIAFIDPLTKLPNRRLFLVQANRLIKACKRRGETIAFGLVDIDDFKLVNDQFGHDVGDEVLTNIAEVFKDSFRADDAICRLGGEEFAFAVAIGGNADATTLAEKLQTSIRALRVNSLEGKEIKISASFGINVADPNNEVILENQIKQADQAMYEAKRAGKNCFRLKTPSSS